MKIIKKILKVSGIVLLSLLLLAFTLPYAFKKQITALVKTEINKTINANVDFSDVSLSLFHHFPKVSIEVNNLSIVGTGVFKHDTLISAQQIDVTAGLFSLLRGKSIKIVGAYLKSPRIHALVNENGEANWDIAKESASTNQPDTAASAFKVSLQNYSISDGYVEYKDKSSNIFTEWREVNHKGSGDFTLDEFTLSTVTEAKYVTIIQDNIPYFLNTKTDISTDIQIDTRTDTYRFKTDDIVLNNLRLKAAGFFQLENDSTYNMDISFQSPTNEFRDILSLIPAIYKQDFNKIKTSGEAVFNGFVKGRYSPTTLPAFDILLGIKNGSFQYPDLPKPVNNIQVSLRASNPDGLPDNTVINISKGHIEMGNQPFDFSFLFKNPETARYIDAVAKGTIDLSQLSQFIKLENGTKLSGLVAADAYAKGNMSSLENRQGPFNAGGYFSIKDLFYSSSDFPEPVRNGYMNIQLANSGGLADKTMINISSGHVDIGDDPVDFSLQVTNPVTAINFSGTANGRFTLDHIKQFSALEPGTIISGVLNAALNFQGTKAMITKGNYDQLAIKGTATLANAKYIATGYPTGITVSTIAAGFNPSNVTVSNFAGNYLGSNFSGNGTLNNLLPFLIKNEPLSGTINGSADKINLNDWIGTEENTAAQPASSSASASGPFQVPANMNIHLNVNAGEVMYDKVNYSDVKGSLWIRDETVKLEDVRTNALEGTITFNGSYSTKRDSLNPDISLNYIIKDINVQKAFFAYNTLQALMPIGKFLSGKLNSELTMTGNLKGDMMPELKSLTGKGNLLLIEGVLNKFAPLEKIGTVLQIDRLKSITVKDIKSYIEFSNGKVLVKPFKLKVQDIEMEIGGMHGFDQSIDYIVDMKVPRAYLGSQGNNLINGLATQAINKGLPVKISDVVDLNIKVGGSMNSPEVKVDLEQVVGNAAEELKKQAEDFAKEKFDSVKTQVKDTITKITDKLKDTLKQKIQEQIFGKDSSSPAMNKIDTIKKQPVDNIKKTLNDILNKNKKTKPDSVKNDP